MAIAFAWRGRSREQWRFRCFNRSADGRGRIYYSCFSAFSGDTVGNHDDITSVTCNSVALTKIGATVSGAAAAGICMDTIQLSPTTGSSQNVVITTTANHYILAAMRAICIVARGSGGLTIILLDLRRAVDLRRPNVTSLSLMPRGRRRGWRGNGGGINFCGHAWLAHWRPGRHGESWHGGRHRRRACWPEHRQSWINGSGGGGGGDASGGGAASTGGAGGS